MSAEPNERPAAAPPRRLARLWRWTWRSAFVLVVLVVLGVAGALLFVESDAARDLARDTAAEHGLTLDYGSLEVSPFSGVLTLDALRLPMPDRCLAHGEDWLTVDRVDVRWNTGEALAGRLRDVRVLVEGVALVYAIDTDGTDCLQLALAALLGDVPTESTPLSQSLAGLVLPPELAGLEVTSLEVRGVRGRFVDASSTVVAGDAASAAAHAVEPFAAELEGLSLRGAGREEGGVLRGELVLGSDDTGLRVQVAGNEARLTMEHRVTLGDEIALTSSTTLRTLELEAPLVDVEALRLPRELLVVDATAGFDPDAARTNLRVSRLAVLLDVATGHGGVVVPDEGLPTIEESAIEVDLDSLAAAIPELVDLAFDDVRATARATPIEGSQDVRVELDARATRIALPEERAVLDATSVSARGTWSGERVSFEAEVHAGALSAKEADVTLVGRELTLDARATELALDGTSGAASVSIRFSELSTQTGDLQASLVAPTIALEAPSVREPSLTLTSGAVDLRSGTTRAQLPSLALSAAAHDLDATFAAPVPFEGSLRAPKIALGADGLELTPRDVVISFDGVARSASELDLRTRTQVASIDAHQDVLAARVEGLDLRLALNALVLTEDGPRATLVVDGRTRRVDLRDAIQHVVIDRLGVESRAPIAGGTLARLSGRISVGNVRFATADREPTPIVERGELSWTLADLRIDPVLARSRARMSAELQLWPIAGAEPEETPEEIAAREVRRAERRARLVAEAVARGEEPPTFDDGPRERTLRAGLGARFDRGAGELDVELRGRTVAMLGPLLGMDELALERARARMNLHGTYTGLDRADPTITHRGELSLRRIGFRSESGAPLVFPRITATLDHRARTTLHDATLRVEIEAPTLGEETLPHGVTLVTTARADVEALTIRTETRSENAGEMSLSLDVDASLDASGTLVHRERFVAEGLRGLVAWMPPELHARAESAQLEGEGRVHHAIDAATPTFEQSVAVRLGGLTYVDGELRATSPEVRFEVQLRGDPSAYSGESAVHLPLVDVLDGMHHVTFHGAEQRVRWVSRGPIESFALDVHVDSQLERVEQDFVPAYPMEDLTLDIDLATNGLRSMRMDHFALVNARGGTRLEMNKTLDRGRSYAIDANAEGMSTDEAVESDLAHEGAEARVARRGEHLVLRGRLEQDLARLDGAPEELVARGRVVVPFTLESGDGTLFRAHARAELDDVHVSLPAMGIALEGVRANVPVEEAFELTSDGGFELVANTERSAFARVRHQDLQALLDGETFFEVESLRVDDIVLGPLVGSLFVDRNVFAIEGVRIQRDEALITGQVLVDYLPGRESITFRGNITGLRTRTSRKPLDANCAVVFTPSRLELDGRVQIVRVATAHLRGLLDLLDPYREDPSFNSLRSVLRFAHPNRVTLDLSQGLMSLEVELGGIVGRFLDFSAIRGIPLGPFMNRHVAPILGRDE